MKQPDFMKLKGVLAVSLLLNLVALAYLGSRPAALVPKTEGDSPAKVVTKTITRTQVTTNEVALPPELVQMDWRTVEEEDFKKYIANLRAIKCPEETIRDIIIADINKLYAAKWRALRQPTKDIKYWEPWDSTAEYYDQNLRKQKRELEKERKDLVMELLGVDFDYESRKYAIAFTGLEREEILMGFLEEGKRAEITTIRSKSRELAAAIQEKAKNGRLTAEDQAELIKVRTWEQTEMKKLLTPQEFEQYVMRVSMTANNIRSQLVGFGPSEQEFTAVFRAQTWYNDQFNKKVLTGAPEEAQERIAAQQQMDQMVKQALGEDRYKEYQRSKDYEYRELVRFTQQNELPMQTA
ncbi:MAG: hypothetical protein K0Q55_3470, partial [Verrucomicrobia bacterium]|nr:hypothetical protein [Verrucomicrobiota bacterium]